MNEKDFQEYEKSIPKLAEKAFKEAEDLALKITGQVVKIQDGFLGVLYVDGSFEPLKEMKPFNLTGLLQKK